MKCPKCSYTSFDYLDSCKRCGNDLLEVRSVLQVIAVSPEDRAPVVGGASALAYDSPSPEGFVPSTPVTVPEGFEDDGEELDFGARREAEEDLLSDVNFDDSFDSVMEPTSPAPALLASEPKIGAPAAQAAGAGIEAEDELVLDLDGLDDFVESSLREQASADEEPLDLDSLVQPPAVRGAPLTDEEPLSLNALVEPTSLREAAPAEEEPIELDGFVEPTSFGSATFAGEEPLGLAGLVQPTNLRKAAPATEEALELDGLMEPTSRGSATFADEEPLDLDGLMEPTSFREAAAEEQPLELDAIVEPTSLSASSAPEEEPLQLDELNDFIEPTSLRADSSADAQELEFEEDGMGDLLDLDFGDVFGDAKEERQ